MALTVLAAGDHFVLGSLLGGAAREAVRDAVGADHEVEVRELTLPWPLEPFGPVGEVDEASGTEEQLVEALQGVQVCLTQLAPLTTRVLEACPDLQMFGVSRGGPVNANLDAATAHGVVVTYAPGRNAPATAEHTVGLMLAAARRIAAVDAELHGGSWRGDYYAYDEVGPELGASTVGLVGYGAIGRRVARVLLGFGARVLVHDPFVSADDLDGPVRAVGLDELLATSDVVSLHARATSETAGLIGADEIAAMRRGSVLVNCARGTLLDHDALCDALDRGHLFGAALDVYPVEPIPAGSRLLRTAGLVLTPHLAGASKPTARRAADILAADVGRFVRGERPHHVANADVMA